MGHSPQTLCPRRPYAGDVHQPSEDRRPLRSRQTRWASGVAGWLTRRGVRPNQISLASVGFAALAAVCLILSRWAGPPAGAALLLAGAAFIQLRLLCNLFDGMVAVEGGMATKSGGLFNDLPDRVSDPLILIAAGYSTSW